MTTLKEKIQTLTDAQRAWLNWQIAMHPARQAAEGSNPAPLTLCAFVMPKAEATVTAAELQSFLTERLPDYMVPATFHFIAEIPRTPNGKVNRQALMRMAQQQQTAREITAPRSALETVLLGIWKAVLQRENIGITDNFFQLGGHSLLVTALIAQIRDLFELEVPLSSVFEAPTIEQLAGWMTRHYDEAALQETAQLIMEVAEMSEEEAAEKLNDENSGS